MKRHFIDLFLGLLHATIAFYLVHLTNEVQPAAYMDEYFHEKQTQAYLAGRWSEWDPYITTPPGLYLLTAVILKPQEIFLGNNTGQNLSVTHFRHLNALHLGVNAFLVSSIMSRLCRLPLPLHLLYIISTVTLPVLFFTSFLFYTDQVSLAAVLATALAFLSKRPLTAFFLACFACCVRQTNIVWCAFLVGMATALRLSSLLKDRGSPTKRSAFGWLLVLLRSPLKVVQAVFQSIVYDAPLLTLVGGLFMVFLWWNGGIVLGDRSSHEFTLHIPQLLYFLAFCAAHTPIRFLLFLLRLSRSFCSRRGLPLLLFLLLSLTALSVASVHCCTVAHKYILADNRHYTFYVWQRLFKRYAAFRYVLTPVYALAGLYVAATFFPTMETAVAVMTEAAPCRLLALLRLAIFLVCTAACLIPSPLIECRYFIVPFVVWRLMTASHAAAPPAALLTAASEVLLNVAVNFVTVYVFLYRPFFWDSQPTVMQRFMW
ncbi:glucosyltransferase [Sparganum proliferum]